MGYLQLDSRAVALVGIFIVVGYVVLTIRQWARLRHFKGPALAGFSQLWLISRVGGGRTHLDLWEACKKYGKLVIRPPLIHIIPGPYLPPWQKPCLCV